MISIHFLKIYFISRLYIEFSLSIDKFDTIDDANDIVKYFECDICFSNCNIYKYMLNFHISRKFQPVRYFNNTL